MAQTLESDRLGWFSAKGCHHLDSSRFLTFHNHGPLRSLRSSHSGFSDIPKTRRAHSCLRAVALALLSTWDMHIIFTCKFFPCILVPMALSQWSQLWWPYLKLHFVFTGISLAFFAFFSPRQLLSSKILYNWLAFVYFLSPDNRR